MTVATGNNQSMAFIVLSLDGQDSIFIYLLRSVQLRPNVDDCSYRQ